MGQPALTQERKEHNCSLAFRQHLFHHSTVEAIYTVGTGVKMGCLQLNENGRAGQ